MGDDKKAVSFLHEAQQFGKAAEEKMEVSDLDRAIASVHEIMNEEGAEIYRSKPEEEWPGMKLVVYCHDCRGEVPPLVTRVRGKMRPVCGDCKSVKISMGGEDGVRRFYHLEKK